MKNEPYRIRADETFKIQISMPENDCPCGAEWGELQCIKTNCLDGVVDYHIRCPRCHKRGPRTQTAFEAGLAWGGMLSREEGKANSG